MNGLNPPEGITELRWWLMKYMRHAEDCEFVVAFPHVCSCRLDLALFALFKLETRADMLTAALTNLYAAYRAVMRDEYDFPNNPWTPERGHLSDGSQPDEAALQALAALSSPPSASAATESRR